MAFERPGREQHRAGGLCSVLCLIRVQGKRPEYALLVPLLKGKTMSYVGKVRKGTVILPPGIDLPEGSAVRIEPVQEETLAKRLKKVIGSIEGLPSDFAENHDHYIHGNPKK